MAFFLPLVIVTRLPFLWTGYGSDADAWLVANAAEKLWHTGEYTVSRFPGFPLYEILSAPFVTIGGAVLSNAMTLAASLALLFALFRLAKQFLHHTGFIVLTLAFMPLFWINSAVTMDYVWSLFFLTISLHCALRDKILASGVWLGIAAGFRLPNLVAGIPLLLILYYVHDEKSLYRMITFLLSAAAVMLLAYSPILIKYGPIGWERLTRSEMSDIHPTWADRLQFFCYRSVYAIGPLAFFSFWYILAVNRRELKKQLRSRNPLLIGSVAGISTFLLLFLILPLERAYLLPAMLFVLILLGILSSRTQLLIFALCCASFGFLNPDIIRHEGRLSAPAVNVHTGMVVEELQRRTQLLDDRVRIATLTVGGEAMIMTGGGAAFWFQNPYVEPDTAWQRRGLKEQVVRSTTNHALHFIALLSPGEIANVRSSGCTVYCLDTAQEFVERITGTSMVHQQVIVLRR